MTGNEPAQADEPAARRVVTFRLMVDQPYAELQRTVQRLVDFVAVGLAGVGLLAQGPAKLPVFPMVRLGRQLPTEELTKEYQRWLIDRAIEGCVETFEPLLKRVWGVCRLSDQDRTRAYTAEEVEQLIPQIEGAELEPQPLGAQLQRFNEQYPDLFGKDLFQLITELKKLRVCLTHAGGVVRARDANEEDQLVFPITEIWFEAHDEQGEHLVTPGWVAERGGTLVLRRRRENRKFSVGDRIEVTLSDFVGIAYTIWDSALHLRERAASFLKDRGLLPPDFQLPTPTEKVVVQFEAPESDPAATVDDD